jgi:aminoglycoside 6-adenylyltransferase
VRAVALVGSQAREEAPADRWSDLDVILFLDDPDRFAREADWVQAFGVPLLTFVEPTAVGDRIERRVLFEDGQDVDFVLLSVSDLDRLDEVRSVLARGYRVLHDEIGVEEALATVPPPDEVGLPDADALREVASDFWYHAFWTAKKLRRGEVFTALGCLDGYLKWRLVTLLEWQARSLDPEVDTWHNGRFLERWADPGALAALEEAYAHYDLRDVARALWATIDLWQGLEEEVARRLGLDVGLDHADLRRRLAEIVPDTRRGLT